MARTRISVFVVAISMALALAACGKKKSEEAAAGGAAAGKPGAAAKAAAAKSGLSVFPKDTSFVFGLSFDKVRATKLWQQFGQQALMTAQSDLDDIKTTCGIDAVSDIQSVMFGGKSFEDEDSFLIVLKGKWDEAKVNKCLQEVAKKEGEQIEISKEGKLTSYKGDGDTMWAAWSGDTVMISQNKDTVSAAAAGGSTVTDNPMMAGLLEKTDTSAMVWVAGIVPAEQAPTMQEAIGGKPEGFYLNLNMPKALDAAVGFRFADDAAAKAAVEKISTEIKNAGASQPMLAAYLKGVTTAAAGKDAVVTVKLDEAQMDQLIEMVKGQLGMLMMMGMGGGMGGGMDME